MGFTILPVQTKSVGSCAAGQCSSNRKIQDSQRKSAMAFPGEQVLMPPTDNNPPRVPEAPRGMR